MSPNEIRDLVKKKTKREWGDWVRENGLHPNEASNVINGRRHFSTAKSHAGQVITELEKLGINREDLPGYAAFAKRAG